MRLESYFIPEDVAQEGIFRDSTKLGATLKEGPYFDMYGNKNGYFYIITDKYINERIGSWVSARSDFNKSGGAFIKKLVDTLHAGFKYAKENSDKFYNAFIEGRHEDTEKIQKEFDNILSPIIAINIAWNRGSRYFNGIPEPVSDSIKKEMIKYLTQIREISLEAAKFVKDNSVKNAESKALIHRIKDPKYSQKSESRSRLMLRVITQIGVILNYINDEIL